MGRNLEFVKVISTKDFKTVTDWCHQNGMVFNKKMSLKDDLCLTNSKEEEVLSVTIENKLSFNIVTRNNIVWIQQIFVGLEDVLKTSSRQVL